MRAAAVTYRFASEMNQAKRDAPFVAVISGVRVSANPESPRPGISGVSGLMLGSAPEWRS
jgi:hypothetical protein